MNHIFSILTGTGAKRNLTGKLGMAVHGCAALVALAVIYTTTIVYVDLYAMMVVFLSAMLALLFLNVSAGPKGRKDRPSILDWGLVLASLAVGIYFFIESQRIVERITLLFPLETPDLLAASVLLALTIEATRRTVGFGLTSVVLVFVVYNLWGHGLPGALGFREVSYNHFLDIMMFTSDGLFGVPLRVAATYAFLFVMFGTFLSKAGGAEFFYNLSSALAGRRTGGPAKIAVISSGLYGTMSGSPTSDVVTTGSVTIPIMQRLGYSKPLSGSVEVAASTGGSLLPPVMGSAAFIMAEYTGIEYREIAIAGIVPALLYFLCVYAQVHLRSQKLGLKGLSKEETPPLRGTLKNGGLFILPLVALSAALLMGYSPTYVAVVATAVVLLVSMVRRSTRMGPKAIWNALALTTLRMVSVVAACAAAGLVIGGISMTGLGGKFADLVYLLAGNSAFLALLISAVLAIILGMGMPTPSAFILAAVLVGPTLLGMDFSVLQTNMFILYFAVLSAMTPPVAVAAFAASAIADARPLEIATGAVKLAITAFIVPFAFVYGEGLLMVGNWTEIAVSCLSAVVGVLLLSIAVEGFWRQRLSTLPRLGFGLAGLLFITPSWWAVALAVVFVTLAIVGTPHLRLHRQKLLA
ncbi:C4-dicarboxylate ABC transporter permease [Litchfieldella qijiaojingensis]|uniref:C4-dicarboxylate ABC transporter permease n=1 Tax=Litchfieldella qijiaojingensis TaxID=980347 RepID=A0ABQ2ZD35_9GAMM|nr:TRAP transporter fused permease subunit [Halomonas qijiaojingensis]GGY09372.1 C4-dicarboxylate ABC transporter permease [Halomonas qijiaojingensis]